MIKVFLLLVFIVSISLSKSSITLEFETDDGDKTYPLVFGLNEKATFGLDEDLGETISFEAPSPSPYYIFSLLNFQDSTNPDEKKRTRIWGTTDLIPYPTMSVKHIHNFKIWLDGGRKFNMNWKIEGINIDSAKIQDEQGGQFINIDLMKAESYYWENENVPSLNLRLVVWYNSNINSVEVENKSFLVYPNPIKDELKIDKKFISGKIIDINGRVIKDFNNQIVNISDLNSGKYFIILHTFDGKLESSFVIE